MATLDSAGTSSCKCAHREQRGMLSQSTTPASGPLLRLYCQCTGAVVMPHHTTCGPATQLAAVAAWHATVA